MNAHYLALGFLLKMSLLKFIHYHIRSSCTMATHSIEVIIQC